MLVFRRGPYAHPGSRGGYDIALAAAAFEQPVSLLFLDDGVWHLVAGQSSGLIDAKSVEKTLASLGLYDIDSLYADEASLWARGLQKQDRPGAVVTVDEARAESLLSEHERVLVF